MSIVFINTVLKRWVIAATVILGCYSGCAVAEPQDTSFYTNFAEAGLIDQNSQSFEFAAQRGKLMLVNFVFTSCATACPVQTQQLSQLRQSLSSSVLENVVFVSVSLDPANDTPKVMKHFVRHQKIDENNWFFVTGRTEAIGNIAERLKLSESASANTPSELPFDHTTALWLVDRNGRLMMRYQGLPVDIQRVASELNQLSELTVNQ